MAQWGKALATQPGDSSWLLRTNIKVERETPHLSSDPPPTCCGTFVCAYTHTTYTQSVYKTKFFTLIILNDLSSENHHLDAISR